MNDRQCPCGQIATTRVCVEWVSGPKVYAYCDECALEIVEACEGTEILP